MRHAMTGVVLGSLLGLAVVPASWAGNFFDVSDTGNVGIGTTSAGALLDVARPATSSNSELIDIRANGFTQTISSGLTNARFNLFNQYTLSAASAQTVTNGTTLHIAGPPTASGAGPATITTGSALRIAGGTVANTTNAYGLYVDAPTGATNNYAAVFSTGKVGIGTTAPDFQLDARQSANTPAGQFRVDGTGIQTALQLANRNTSGGAAGEGPELTFVGGAGSGAGPNIASIYAAWNGAATTDGYLTFNTRRGGSITEAVRIASSGNVGIGTTSPQGALDVNGKIYLNNWICNSGGGNCLVLDTSNFLRPTSNAGLDLGSSDNRFSTLYINSTGYKPGGGSWSDYSDARLKKEIKTLSNSLSRLLKLRGVTYQWKDPEKRGNLTGSQIGMIGQEVEQVFPEWIKTDQTGYRVLTFRGFEALTVEALRELKQENESLREEIKQLRDQFAKLQRPAAPQN